MRTVDHFQFLMDIEPYQYGTDNTMNGLSVSVSYWKGTGFVAHYQAAERKECCYGVVYDGSRDPLVASVKVDIEPATRNSVKRLAAIFESLRLAQEPIAWLFNHRMWDALNKFIAMVGKYGYHEQIKSSILGTIAEAEAKINNLSTNNTETMKLNISNQKNESANVQNAQVKDNAIELQGSEYAVRDDSGKNVTFASVIPAAIAEPIEEAVVVEDAQSGQSAQSAQSVQSAPSAQSGLPKVSFTTYKTKKGDTAPMIIGFAGTGDPRWQSHKDAGHKYVSAGHRRDINGETVYLLMFGTRYMDVAKALCGAYNTSDVNAWHRAEDACMAIYEQAQRDGKARWEAKKAEWAAARSEKLKVKSEKTRAAEDNDKQVAAMLEKLMKGGEVPDSILKHIDPKVLEAFAKKAA